MYVGGCWYRTENRAHHRKPAGIFRKDPDQLKHLAIKPLHGMSSKGVFVSPDLSVLEKYCSEEPMLAQEMFWATPVMPDINEELS